MLQEKGASVRIYDPHARENAEEFLPGVIWCGSALEAAEKAHIAVMVTEWNAPLGSTTRQGQPSA